MIAPGTALAFYFDLARGIHQPTDEYRIALYSAQADLSPLVESYSTDGEILGSPGYTAGGQVLAGLTISMDGRVAVIDWADPLWPNATITARGALIYNASKGNRAMTVLDFGPSPMGEPRGYSSTNGNFLVPFPEPTAETGLIRIGG